MGFPLLPHLSLLPSFSGLSTLCGVEAVRLALGSSGEIALCVGIDSMCTWAEVSRALFMLPSWTSSLQLHYLACGLRVVPASCAGMTIFPY